MYSLPAWAILSVKNGEFRDRANLDLSGDQQALLELLKSTGKPLVVGAGIRQTADRARG